jgi:hypothetical protein
VVSVCTVAYYYILSKKENYNEIDIKDDESKILIYASFIATILFLAGAIILSGRFIDFYYSFVVFLGALVFTKLFKDQIFIININYKKYFLVASFIFLIFFVGNNFLNKKKAISAIDYRPFEKVAKWTKERSNEKEIVFLSDWSYFSVVFFYNTKNVYSMGIEPQSLMDYSPNLFWKWYNIYNYGYLCGLEGDCLEMAQLRVKEIDKMSASEKELTLKNSGIEIIEVIKKDFNSRFIISTSKKLNDLLELNKDMIDESIEAKSEINNSIIKAYKLK